MIIECVRLPFSNYFSTGFFSQQTTYGLGFSLTITALFFAHAYFEFPKIQMKQDRFLNAIRLNDTASFRSIPISEIDVNAPSTHDMGLFPLAPLHVAAYNGNCEIIQELLNSNADINAYLEHVPGRPITPLLSAIDGSREEAIELLARLGADLFLHNPLIQAAKKNNPYSLLKLLDGFMRRPKDLHPEVTLDQFVNQRNGAGDTALHHAIRNNREDPEQTKECVKILRHFSADPELRNNLGETPYNLAEATGDQELLGLLS